MPPIGRVDGVPVWAWADAVVVLVLVVSLCVVIVRAVPWLRRHGAVPGWTRGIDRAPVGPGLVLALLVTLLVRGHPDQQVLVGVVASALAGASSFRLRRGTRRRRGVADPVITSPP